jgi:hypothetical protein
MVRRPMRAESRQRPTVRRTIRARYRPRPTLLVLNLIADPKGGFARTTGFERGAGLTVKVALHDRPATRGFGGGEIVARAGGLAVRPRTSASSADISKS